MDIPSNSGVWRPVKVIVPEGTILNPRPPAAAAGRGLPGAHSRIVVVQGGREREIGKETLKMKRGDILRLQTTGAGGWGDPAARDPASVLRDVVEGKVSPARAREVYRVAVDAEGRAVNEAQTRGLRQP